MTRLLVGNDFNEDIRGDREWTGWWVQRLLWFAQDGDVLVLPSVPEPDFVAYVTGLTGIDARTLRFAAPPPDGPAEALTPRRLADRDLLHLVSEALAGRSVTDVIALWPDPMIARFARSLGVESAFGGHDFVAQGGGLLLNSKSTFRAIAGGIGLPLPAGGICTSKPVAERLILDILDDEEPVVLKHDYLSGGRGNEILSTGGQVRPIGARRVVIVKGRADVTAYLDERWDWLSGDGHGRPVVERYHQDSSAFFAECHLDEEGVVLGGTGELLSAPYAVGQIMPAQGLSDEVLSALNDGARKLCEAMHTLGYRGVLGPDAIVTPEQEVLFTEYNGRVTGSTHIYGVIGQRVIGPGFGNDRLILERVWPEGWAVSGYADARDRLIAAGYAYDTATRTGVVLTNAFDGRNGVMYCIAAADLDQAWRLDRALHEVFTAR